MKPDQYDALAQLMGQHGGASTSAARMVLVEGLSVATAAAAVGISRQAVNQAVVRCRDALALAHAATAE